MEVLRQFVQSFRFLSVSGVDHRVLSDVVKACASVSELTSGRALHGCVAKLGHLGCNEVSKSVLNMYAKCRRMDDCKKMFRQMKSVDPVVWNIVLTGLSHSCAHETMRFFKGMLFEDEPSLAPLPLPLFFLCVFALGMLHIVERCCILISSRWVWRKIRLWGTLLFPCMLNPGLFSLMLILRLIV